MNLTRKDAFFLIFSIGLLAVLSGPVRELVTYAMDWDNTNASQIVLIPFVTAALIYWNRGTIFGAVETAPLPSLLAFGVGAVLFALSVTYQAVLQQGDRLALSTSAIIAFWLGGFLLAYGTKAFRAAMFPLLFLFFCSPIPSPIQDRLITVLQYGSAEVAYWMLQLSGTPVHRASTVVFALPDLTIEVAPECSGIRSGISLLILSLIAGHVLLKSGWRRCALVVLTIPVLLFKNALRIGTLSLLAVHVDQRIITSRLHREGGIPFFIVGLLLLYPVLAALVKSEVSRRAAVREAHT